MATATVADVATDDAGVTVRLGSPDAPPVRTRYAVLATGADGLLTRRAGLATWRAERSGRAMLHVRQQ
jgi:flavin-dependent dehydrogenase